MSISQSIILFNQLVEDQFIFKFGKSRILVSSFEVSTQYRVLHSSFYLLADQGPENICQNLPENLPKNLPQSILSEIGHTYEAML